MQQQTAEGYLWTTTIIILYLLFGSIWKHPQIEKFDP